MHTPPSLLKWTIETIRQDDSMLSWLEERKFEWEPLVRNTLLHLLEGTSIIVLTDTEREWFRRYVMQSINRPQKGRPFLPFYPLESVFPGFALVKSAEEMQLLHEMLSLSFRNGYLFWYVGKFDDASAKIALHRDENFIWVLDEEFQNSFSLSSTDELLDIKLLQLFRIFDKTISASLFGEVVLGV